MHFYMLVLISKLFLCRDIIFTEVSRLDVVLKAYKYFCVVTFPHFFILKLNLGMILAEILPLVVIVCISI